MPGMIFAQKYQLIGDGAMLKLNDRQDTEPCKHLLSNRRCRRTFFFCHVTIYLYLIFITKCLELIFIFSTSSQYYWLLVIRIKGF
jgi:hypothetical protein